MCRPTMALLSAGLLMHLMGSEALAQQTHCKAGWPEKIACWAAPSENPHYVGYYVGGGAACGGDRRGPHDGTWGWDYAGCLLPHRVILRWVHCRRYQGGMGAYATDGPEVPNIIPTITHPRESIKAHREERREKKEHREMHSEHGGHSEHSP